MSSPTHRRQKSSQSGTPRRSAQRKPSQALPSSPPDASAAQLHSEAASSQNDGTPRRAPPSSSPMNYRSSPADAARLDREREVSSPLRQMTNTQTTQDGDRTPRASGSGLLGGMLSNQCLESPNFLQYLLQFDMHQALLQEGVDNHLLHPIFTAIAALSSCATEQILDLHSIYRDVVISMQIT